MGYIDADAALQAVIELLGVQIQGDAHPDEGVPCGLQQEHEMGVHRPDPPVHTYLF